MNNQSVSLFWLVAMRLIFDNTCPNFPKIESCLYTQDVKIRALSVVSLFLKLLIVINLSRCQRFTVFHFWHSFADWLPRNTQPQQECLRRRLSSQAYAAESLFLPWCPGWYPMCPGIGSLLLGSLHRQRSSSQRFKEELSELKLKTLSTPT